MRSITRFRVRKGAAALAGGVLLFGVLTACQDDDEGGPSPFLQGGNAQEAGQDKGGKDGKNDGKGDGKAPDGLVGTWTSGSVSMIRYEDAITGAAAPPSGNNSTLTFTSDGTYTNNGLLQTTMYNCTTSLFVMQEGKYSVDGDKVTFKPGKVKTSMKNTCSKSGNYNNRDGEKKVTTETFELGQNESGPTLKLTDDTGASSTYTPQES